MDITGILQAISSVGFPIVMCLIFVWYIKYLNEKHSSESEKMIEAVNNNTIVLQQLCESIKYKGEE